MRRLHASFVIDWLIRCSGIGLKFISIIILSSTIIINSGVLNIIPHWEYLWPWWYYIDYQMMNYTLNISESHHNWLCLVLIHEIGWMEYDYTSTSLSYIFASCMLAFCVNLSIFLVIGKTDPIAYNVLGHFKLCVILLTGYIIHPQHHSFVHPLVGWYQ